MRYVVLLRGINVGGNNKISMSELRQALLDASFTKVITYINSGNILLTSQLPLKKVNAMVRETIKKVFALDIPTITLSKPNFLYIAHEIPAKWINNNKMKCDCFFLWQDINQPEVLEYFSIEPGIDHTKYVSGAVLWSVDRNNIVKSGLGKVIKTKIYQKMTIRNANTVRKLADLLNMF